MSEYLPDSDPTRTRSEWTERNPNYRKHGWAKRDARHDDHEPWPFITTAVIALLGLGAFLCWIMR